MLRLIPAIAVLCFAPALASKQRTNVDRLRQISVIYVAELGQTEQARNLSKNNQGVCQVGSYQGGRHA